MIKPKNLLHSFIKSMSSSRSRNSEDDLDKIAAKEQKHFTFDTLVRATTDFHPSNKLGEGGFGPVYKGKLNDGREVAVKRLSLRSNQGKKEFLNEAKLLSRVQHRNVVNLLGYCVHGAEKLLVYDGYMAPEYLMYGNLSVKADVFSFGVLILELISAQRNSNFSLPVDAHNLLDWAYKLFKKGKTLQLMDIALTPSAIPEQVALCIHIGLLCTQGDPQLRPNMRRVVVMLSKKPENVNLEEPSRPGVPESRYKRSRKPTGMSSSIGSSFSGETTNTRTLDSTYNSNSVSAAGSTSTQDLTHSRLDRDEKSPEQK
ncbi:hypothetical protein ACFE04_017287 [Oxalis oulophora]